MRKIVHFGKYYFPDAGGIESVTLSLAKGAANAGYHVSVVCFGNTASNGENLIDGVEVIRAPAKIVLASQPLGIKYFFDCISAARRADIIHLHAPNMLAAFCALFIASSKNLLVHWHSDVINKGLIGKISRALEYALLRRADMIVATSQVYADASRSLSDFKRKVVICPIGVPDKKWVDEESKLPTELEEQIRGRKIILSVGRLVTYKGFDVLVRAAQQISKNAVVVIVGGGPLEAELQHAIDLSDAKDQVFLAGKLCDSTLHALFERASVYCLPSTNRAEAFGVVMLEAMAHGLPVVACDIPGSGVPWVNQHGVSGFNVAVGDPIALAEACNKILTSFEIQKRLSQGARHRFISEFSEQTSINQILRVYARFGFRPF
jgi:glycosyltransferase involved in cell wall biosynthesis